MAADKISTKGIVYAALFGAFTAAGAFIVIPLPPVPITAQTFFMNVAAILLGGTLGALSQVIYIMLGVVGLPVFAGGKAGLGVLFGPTGGYLAGFVLAAFVIGTVNRLKNNPGMLWHIFSMLIGMCLIYLLGISWLAFTAKMSFQKALAVGALPFIPGDLLKIALAALVSFKLKDRIKL
jgi:biotin transport system substrate-specific component